MPTDESFNKGITEGDTFYIWAIQPVSSQEYALNGHPRIGLTLTIDGRTINHIIPLTCQSGKFRTIIIWMFLSLSIVCCLVCWSKNPWRRKADVPHVFCINFRALTFSGICLTLFVFSVVCKMFDIDQARWYRHMHLPFRSTCILNCWRYTLRGEFCYKICKYAQVNQIYKNCNSAC